MPDLQIRFGKETLVLDTWQRRKQYDALCAILGPGLNLHLAENELLRDIFHLGPRTIVTNVTIKHTKLERVSSNERWLASALLYFLFSAFAKRGRLQGPDAVPKQKQG